jgi:hypothetical protein
MKLPPDIKKQIEERIMKIHEKIDTSPADFCYNLENYNSLDFPIYRIISIVRFLELLNTKKLVLPNTSIWEDVYENYFLKKPINFQNHKVSLKDQIVCMYGQCWSKLIESDALWRIYSGDKKSVKIKSTPSKILKGIISSKDYDYTKILGIKSGIVSYHSKDYIKKIFNDVKLKHIFNNASEFMIKSLFIKRNEFSHEQEVRIILKYTFTNDISQCFDEKIKKFSIAPNDLIDEVVFDPRCDNSYFLTFHDVIKKCGFVGDIKKSDLYTLD